MISIISTILLNPISMLIFLFIFYYKNKNAIGEQIIRSIFQIQNNSSRESQLKRQQHSIRMKTIESTS